MHPTSPYEAPLYNADLPEWQKVPGSYAVFLRPGYSFEQHKSTVSETIDLDLHTRRVFTNMVLDRTHYIAFDISEVALDAIRADTKGAMVKCSRKAWIPEGEMLERP